MKKLIEYLDFYEFYYEIDAATITVPFAFYWAAKEFINGIVAEPDITHIDTAILPVADSEDKVYVTIKPLST